MTRKTIDIITVVTGIIGIFVCLYFTVATPVLLHKMIGTGFCICGVAGLICTFGAMLRRPNTENIRDKKAETSSVPVSTEEYYKNLEKEQEAV